MDLPLLEDDLSAPGVIDASALHPVPVDGLPATAVLCFFPEVVERLAATGARRICTFRLESGHTPVPEIEVDGHRLAVLQPGVGAPLATIFMEDLIALGVRPFAAEGCAIVEMEASALIAVARYRGVGFAQLLLAGDSLAGEAWEHRGWTAAEARQGLFEVAAQAAAALAGLQ